MASTGKDLKGLVGTNTPAYFCATSTIHESFVTSTPDGGQHVTELELEAFCRKSTSL